MKKFWPLFALTLISVVPAFSQPRRAVARPTPPDESDVVRISTNLIQVDVTVTDKKGNAVRDLKPEEIEIYENGKLQKISNFSFVAGTRQTDKSKQPGAPNAGPTARAAILPGEPIRPEQVRRTIALVVDDLNLSFGSVVWVRGALKKFVNEQILDGDLVAIIRTGAGVGALQQFTTDRRQLLAAIERVKFNSGGNAGLSFFNPVSLSTTQDVVTAPASGMTDSEPVFDISGGQNASNEDQAVTFNQFRENIFASGTLGALNFIVRGMSELPGRKSVVFLSDGLNIVTRDNAGRPQLTRIYTAMKHLIDLANRASVVFYTIHAPGLEVPMLNAEDEVSGISRIGGEKITSNIIAARINRLNDTQEGLRYLADETGGLAYINQNNISAGIRRALDDQSYYLVGYEPDEATFNANASRYNKFEVKVKRPGVEVRYRSGFYGFSEEQIVKPKLTALNTIVNALTSPFSVKDIGVRMNALFADDEQAGSFVRAFINVDGGDLKFVDEPGGRHKATFDLVAFTFGDNGTVIDERSKTITLNLAEAEYKKFLERGLISTFALPVKKPGGYQVRLAIRDASSGRVGSANQYVEIPDVKKDRLTLSGMVVENVPLDTWRRVRSSPADVSDSGDPQWDTSVRQFRAGSVLRFGYHIYNAKTDESQRAELTYRLRLHYQGQPVFDGSTAPIQKLVFESRRSLSTTGALLLGESLAAGDYILQVDVTDRQGKNSGSTATQFIQFEIVE